MVVRRDDGGSTREIWLIAADSVVMAQLLEAAVRAELVGSVLGGIATALQIDVELPPLLIVVDGAAVVADTDREALVRLRARFPSLPIVVLDDHSARDWYAAGVTVVLPANVSSAVIGAQLRVLADRLPVGDLEVELVVGPFRYQHGRRTIEFAGQALGCGPGPARLLLRLLRAGGDVVTSPALIRAVHGSPGTEQAALGAQLHRLRRCLDAVAPGLSGCIVSVRGEGYRLDLEQAYRAQQVTSRAQSRDRT